MERLAAAAALSPLCLVTPGSASRRLVTKTEEEREDARDADDFAAAVSAAMDATLSRWDRVYDTGRSPLHGRFVERPPPVFLGEQRVNPGPTRSGCSLYRYVRDLAETRRLLTEKVAKIIRGDVGVEPREVALQLTLVVHSTLGCILSPRSYVTALPEDTSLWVSTVRHCMPRRRRRHRHMPTADDAIGQLYLLAEDLEERPTRDDITEVCGVPLRGLVPSRMLDKYGFECYAVQLFRGETLRECIELDPLFEQLPPDLASLVSVRGSVFSLDLRGSEYLYDAHVMHCSANPLPLRFSRLYSCVERLRPALPPAPAHGPGVVAQCRVCMERPVDMCCVPCGHPCCTECITRCPLCPMCRSSISSIQRIFWV